MEAPYARIEGLPRKAQATLRHSPLDYAPLDYARGRRDRSLDLTMLVRCGENVYTDPSSALRSLGRLGTGRLRTTEGKPQLGKLTFYH